MLNWWSNTLCPTALWATLCLRYGIQGAFTVLASIVWFGYGVMVLFHVNIETEGAPHLLLNPPIRGAIWIGTALYALYGVAHKEHRQSGIAGLTFMPLVRMISFAWAFIGDLVAPHVDWIPGSLSSGALSEDFGLIWRHLPMLVCVGAIRHLSKLEKSPIRGS